MWEIPNPSVRRPHQASSAFATPPGRQKALDTNKYPPRLHSPLRTNGWSTSMSRREREEHDGEEEEEEEDLPQQVADLAQASVPSAMKGIRACK